MNKKTLYFIGVIGLIASAAMYFIGKESANLSELKEFWWIPLLVAALALVGAALKK
jgi:hypothetical protein